MIYVDDAAVVYRGKPRFHLAATTLEELHAFAAACGINRCWFHAVKRHPHYDITASQRDTCVAAGAEKVSSKELVLRTAR